MKEELVGLLASAVVCRRLNLSASTLLLLSVNLHVLLISDITRQRENFQGVSLAGRRLVGWLIKGVRYELKPAATSARLKLSRRDRSSRKIF